MLIAFGQQHSHVPLMGLALVLCSAISWACGNIVVKNGACSPNWFSRMGQYSYPFMVLLLAVQNIGWQGVVADWHALTWKGFGAAAFLAYFATIIGYGLWIYLLTRYPVAKISPLSLWVPVISMIFAYLF